MTGASSGRGANWAHQTIWTGDCLDVMRGMNSASVDLIYLDPPFNSNADYAALVGSKPPEEKPTAHSCRGRRWALLADVGVCALRHRRWRIGRDVRRRAGREPPRSNNR